MNLTFPQCAFEINFSGVTYFAPADDFDNEFWPTLMLPFGPLRADLNPVGSGRSIFGITFSSGVFPTCV